MNENIFIKALIIFTACYLLFHVVTAKADIVTINTPDQGIKSCIINGGYITCI